MVQAQPFSTNAYRGTQHTAVETITVQFLQQDEPRQVLGGEWKLQRYRYMLHGNALHITCEETSFKMTADEWVEVADLQSTQEEADIRLLLHALHDAARTGSKAVIVTSKDTDVMLLCLAFQKDAPCPIYHKCGTQNSTRFVETSKLAWSLRHSIRDSLIGLHA